MTTGTFTKSAAGTARDLLSGKAVRTPVALPADLADAKRAVAVPSAGPAHAKPRLGLTAGLGVRAGLGTKTGPGSKAGPGTKAAGTIGGPERRKLGKAFYGLAAISIILILAGVGARHIHITPVNPNAGTTTAHPSTVSSGAAVSRLQDATTDAQSAALPIHTEMGSIPAMPTPQQVSTVTNPYVDMLGLYETVLTSTPAPASAAKAVQALETQLHADIADFGTAATVPRDQLGHFINSFLGRSTVLQTDMSNLQQALRGSSH
jgi:hypothetical protein